MTDERFTAAMQYARKPFGVSVEQDDDFVRIIFDGATKEEVLEHVMLLRRAVDAEFDGLIYDIPRHVEVPA